MSLYIKYALAWIPMLVIAILNGVLRDLGYKRYLGALAAHQLSTLTLILFFSLYTRNIVGHLPPASARQALLLGGLWAGLTLSFEFGFGLARGNSVHTLLADYNLLEGRLWSLIPAFVAVAPYLFYRLLSTPAR